MMLFISYLSKKKRRAEEEKRREEERLKKENEGIFTINGVSFTCFFL